MTNLLLATEILRFAQDDQRRTQAEPAIKGTRIPVSVILEQVAEGESWDKIISGYPEFDRVEFIKKLARLDAPETWHQVTGRGMESRKIFKAKRDREDFLDRLWRRSPPGI